MKRLARVLYSYDPVKSDELKLNPGELIEVLDEEEQGWWRGKLDGREGVFPSNFVELTSNASPSFEQQLPILNQQYVNQNNGNNLNKIANHFNNSNSIDNSNSNFKCAINNIGPRSQMDSQQQHDDENSASCERKPKPVRGVGFGDIFAGGKPKLSPVDGIVTGGDKHNSNNNSINNSGSGHKAIPKKPPPPAPMPDQSNSDSSSEAAPVLPPKPSTAQLSASLNQATSHSQTSSYPYKQQSAIIREQARVIYNYEAQNSDELTIEEGDIINVINKQIEDQGWWKGELRGQIGVFPDNFVELIKVPVPQDQGYTPDLFPPRMQKPSRPPPVVMMSGGPISMVMPTEKNQSLVSTPKGFSKDLETNSDINNVGSSASFLSLNRNKFGSSSCTKPPVAAKSPMNVPQPSLTSMSKPNDNAADNNIRDQTNSYSQSKDLNSLNSAFGSRNHLNNNSSFDSFTSYDSNSGQVPGKLNHLTAQRAKGPSSRRPPSNILAARDNISDNSLDILHNGETKSSNSINQSSLPNNNGNSPAAAINVNQNSQQMNSKSVTPPTNFKPTDSNQDYSSTKLQKSPQQQKETPQTSAVPWMLELRDKTTKKAHSDKIEKKRDTGPNTSAEDSSSSTNNFITNAKQAESPVVSNVAPVKNSPPFNTNRGLSYQQTPTSSLTGGVKSLTSRYSGDFSFSDKGINSMNQNSIVDTSGPNEFVQGSNFKNQSAVNNAGLVNKPTSAINSRPGFPSVNSSSSRSQDAEASSLPSERSPASGYSPSSIANRHNTSSSNSISSTPTLHQGSSSNISNQTNSNQVKASDDVYPYSKLNSDAYGPQQNSSQNNFFDKDTSPSDVNTVVNDENSSSAQRDFLKQQQMTIANTSEIEMLKEELRRLREDFKKASITNNEFNSLSNQINELRTLMENQKRTHGNLIKDLINDLADERKKTATMQIEIDRLQKLTSAV